MSPAAILIVGLGVVLALPLVWRVLTHRFDPFEPVVLFVLAWAAMFVARPASMLVHGELTKAGVDLRSTFAKAIGLALVGGVAFIGGYELRIGAVLARRLPAPREIGTRDAVVWSIVLTVIAASAYLVLVSRFSGLHGFRVLFSGRSNAVDELSAESSYVWFASRLVLPAAFGLLAIAVRERSRRIGLGAAALVVASLAVTVPLGSRAFLLPFLGGIFVFAYLYRQSRPSTKLLVALVFTALLASYVLAYVRDTRYREDARPALTRLVHRPDEVFHPILEGNDAEMAPVLAGALTAIPDRLHYRYGGAVLGDLVRRPIPRRLWEGKPEPSPTQIVDAVWPSLSKIFHPEFSPLIFLYWDFGIPGVVVGMALFGFLFRALYEWFVRHRDRLAAQIIFASALWFVVFGARSDPVNTIVLVCFIVLPIVVLERVSGRSWSMVGAPLLRPGAREE